MTFEADPVNERGLAAKRVTIELAGRSVRISEYMSKRYKQATRAASSMVTRLGSRPRRDPGSAREGSCGGALLETRQEQPMEMFLERLAFHLHPHGILLVDPQPALGISGTGGPCGTWGGSPGGAYPR